MPKANKYQIFKYNKTDDDYVFVQETTDTIFVDSGLLEPLTKYFYKVKIRILIMNIVILAMLIMVIFLEKTMI